MQFTQPFDARTVEPAGFAAPPVMGDYHVRITDSEPKPTSKGDGGMLVMQLEILDPGPYQGRKIPYYLNLFHPNPQTVEIAYRQLSAICHATNKHHAPINDSRELFNIPFIATIGPQKDNPQYSNVFGVKDINGNVPGKASGSSTAVPAPPAPPAVTAAPVWGAPPPTTAPAPAWGPPPTAAPPAPAAPAQAWGPPQPNATPAWGSPGQAPGQAPPAAPVWGATPPPAGPPAWAK